MIQPDPVTFKCARCGCVDKAIPVGAMGINWFDKYQHVDPSDCVTALLKEMRKAGLR